jgi:hypothetical protein
MAKAIATLPAERLCKAGQVGRSSRCALESHSLGAAGAAPYECPSIRRRSTLRLRFWDFIRPFPLKLWAYSLLEPRSENPLESIVSNLLHSDCTRSWRCDWRWL